jgi:hypothetical protein
MGGEGAAAVDEWVGVVLGWVREQAMVVGSHWLEEVVGGERAGEGGGVVVRGRGREWT